MTLKNGASPGADEVEIASVLEIVDHQRAGRLAADDDLVTLPQMLETRGQRPVRHLDREEFQPVLVIGAGDAIGAQQRLLAELQADHGEFAVAETERRIAGGGEAEQRVGPVMNAENAFLIEVAHLSTIRGRFRRLTHSYTIICIQMNNPA
jgi:hypothetical protein